MNEKELLGHFESLGDNCEFGLVQRFVGIEPLGLFRFNFASLPSVIRGLECNFADVDDPDQIEIYTDRNDELMVRVRHYGFQYHTHKKLGDVDLEALRKQQIKAVRFLARKFLDDLRSGEKIFVRKGQDSVRADQIEPLLTAMRRHGAATLLWVVPQDDLHPMGTVEVVRPGVLKGYSDRFAPYDDAYDLSLAVWLDICRGALELWRDGSQTGAAFVPERRPNESNLIRRSDNFSGGGWQCASSAKSALSDIVPRLHNKCAVMEHLLTEETRVETGAVYRHAVADGMSSGSIYTASFWVWLPPDFRGSVVGAVIDGYTSVQIANANTSLRETWQPVWVSAKVPEGVSGANPSLYVIGPSDTRVYSTCWKLELGAKPSEYQIAGSSKGIAQNFHPSGATALTSSGAAIPDISNAREVEASELATVSDADILRHFESLGDSCEFGMVQRAAGVEQLGFFRFNSAPLPGLLKALDTDFVGVDHPDKMEIAPDDNQDLMVRIPEYRFRYHTFANSIETDVVRLRRQQTKAIRFLANKFLSDLQSAEKIFVRKDPGASSGAEIAMLLRSLRRHGPVTVLLVVGRDPEHPTGRVEVVEPGLIKGYIDRFATFDTGFDYSSAWFDICRGAWSLWRQKSPPGTIIDPPTERKDDNLIRGSAAFSGVNWWQRPEASYCQSDAVPRLHSDCAVIEHRLLESTTGANAGVFGYGFAGGLSPDAVYVFSLFVWLPADFDGELVDAAFAGFSSISVVGAEKTLRNAWQRVWVAARLPHDCSSAAPSLLFVGPAGSKVFSTCWKLELGEHPTPYRHDFASHGKARPTVARPEPSGPIYHRIWLRDLPAKGLAERASYLPESCVAALPIMFGTTSFEARDVIEEPWPGIGAEPIFHHAVEAFLLRDVVIHGMFGIITCGDYVIGESLVHLPLHRMGGAEWRDDERLFLPPKPIDETFGTAYHLLTCNLDNYSHWLLDCLFRYSDIDFRGLGVLGDFGDNPCLLVPPLDTDWKKQSFALAIPNDVRCTTIRDMMTVQVDRLLYIPELAGGGITPHRALNQVFDRMRAAAYIALARRPSMPHRRIFVSRVDSTNRVLTNEAELAALAEKAGFERVVLGRMSVAEQISLFAEASHIIAQHGAGLTNLAFCRPGTAICELQMDCYVQAAFRRLAALRSLRYGCIIGSHIPPRKSGHQTTFRIEPTEFAAVLAAPRFIGD